MSFLICCVVSSTSTSIFTPAKRLANKRFDPNALDDWRILLQRGPSLGSVKIVEDAIRRSFVVPVDDDHAPIIVLAFELSWHRQDSTEFLTFDRIYGPGLAKRIHSVEILPFSVINTPIPAGHWWP